MLTPQDRYDAVHGMGIWWQLKCETIYEFLGMDGLEGLFIVPEMDIHGLFGLTGEPMRAAIIELYEKAKEPKSNVV